MICSFFIKVENGVNPRVVQELLGHKDYIHLACNARDDEANIYLIIK